MNKDELYSVFNDAWSKETSYPPDSTKWSKNTPSIGQCAVTALIVNDLLGGKILFNRKFNHYWNELPNHEIIDLTIEQFGEETNMLEAEQIQRIELLNSRGSKTAKTLERYKKLKSKVLPLLFIKP